jgi:hypothetical protein
MALTKASFAFDRYGQVDCPEPAGRNVNTMPLIVGSKDTLPDDPMCYYPLIEQCPYPYMADEIGTVGYLTVHESYIDTESAQRRKGIHIESPGLFCDDHAAAFLPWRNYPWGLRVCWGPDKYEGDTSMASSVANTREVCDALVNKNVPGIVDKHEGCELLCPLFGRGPKLHANELIWMTDCTPHEALPQEPAGHRKFRDICVSHWYADHWTEDPKVNLPSNVSVIHGSKFNYTI